MTGGELACLCLGILLGVYFRVTGDNIRLPASSF